MSGRKGPRAVTATQVVKSLHIDDTSMATIANCMKQHSKDHGMWIAYKREVYKQELQTARELEIKVAELVSRFSKTASSASATTNYAKYDVVLDPDIKRLRENLDSCKEINRFISDVDRLFSKRADILSSLLKIDHESIVRGKREAFDLNLELRDTIQSFNTLTEQVGKPWR